LTDKGAGSDVDLVPAAGPTRVLFVCTHNSARSIMAEVLLRKKGGAAYDVASAGTEPGGIRPLTLQVLEEAGLPTAELRSKSVSELMGQPFDYVITVCDSARQHCPVFPGQGQRLHWGYDDPSAAEGSDEERLQAFRRVFTAISQRIDLFLNVERGRGSTAAS
jgi:protein-tyrosine-phosphatase